MEQMFGVLGAALRRMEMGCRDEFGWECIERA